jgi:hypothetical protein
MDLPLWDDDEWEQEMKEAGRALHLWMATNALVITGLAVAVRFAWKKVRR